VFVIVESFLQETTEVARAITNAPIENRFFFIFYLFNC